MLGTRPYSHRLSARCDWNALFLSLFCAIAFSSCTSSKWVSLRETPQNPLTDSLALLSRGGPKPTERTKQYLRRYDLDDELAGDRAALVGRIADINRREPNRQSAYSVAELAYIGAKRIEALNKGKALELYGTAVVYAYEYLFDDTYPAPSNPYDPQFRRACDLYNGALESMLRLVRSQHELRPGTTAVIQTANRECELSIELKSDGWKNEDVDHFEFVSDYEIQGLRNHDHRFGLGVPLIAVRTHRVTADPHEQFYPPSLAFPVTALLQVTPEVSMPWPAPPATAKPQENQIQQRETLHAVLELHDPLTCDTLEIAGRRVPLETDLSTPLAYFLSQPEFDDGRLSTLGLLMPERAAHLSGLYMLEPFQPDKMPVVMVHGLWSSPVTWMEMFNDLRSDRRIRDHYQFWFYLYPSGQPFWYSAAQMREDLAGLRMAVDPQRRFPALDQTVLVGHSMGGLVSKLQTVDSQNDFWTAVSDRPFSELQADEEVRQSLGYTFFFHPNPSIRRVVMIGTPHRGSHFSNDLTRWLGRKAISLPSKLLAGQQQIVAQNSGYFRKDNPLDITTSIDSLDPSSPLVPVLLDAQPGSWIQYHNIVGRVPDRGLLGILTEKFGSEGDGVVSLASAKLDHVDSQIIIPADHTSVHRHPQSILEVHRILLTQIDELYRFPASRTEGTW
ncbi:MAG: hypothetical protein JW829_05025 [Pirellulales bacterium]|nr:hypothetical protein [Pirellulales bacterium]